MKAAAFLLPLCLALSPCTAPAQGTCGEPIDLENLGDASGLTPEQLAVVNKGVTLLVGTTEKCNAILARIKDKGTADAAAPQLQAVMADLDSGWEELQRTATMEQLATIFQLAHAKLGDKATEADAIIQRLSQTEPPFYGSEALAAVLTEEDDGEEEAKESSVLPDQLAAAEDMMEQFLDSANKALEILRGIEDKETADAAADQLKGLMEEIATSWDSIQTWAEVEGIAEELDDILTERYRERLEEVGEMDKIIMRLPEREPAYYGSEALLRALEGPEPAEDEDTDDTLE